MMHLRARSLCALGALALCATDAGAENLTPEQFRVTRDAPERSGSALTFSAVLRERATYLSSIEFDDDAADAGAFWSQRAALSAEGQFSPRWRGRLTMLSAIQRGIEDSPVERNLLDVQEGFVEVDVTPDAWLRVGRQELVLGSQRLIGSRNGTNVKRTWDGLRWSSALGDWHVDALAMREVRVASNGILNDDSGGGPALAGLYATGSIESLPGHVDLYYLYTGFENRRTIEGTADQDRHTVGLRSFGDAGRWFWNWEAIAQFGEHGDSDIGAWSLATNTGYRFDDRRWRPELMLSVNVASGDSGAGDGDLGTFDALFARGSYFSELALLAPSNFINVHPYLKFHPTEHLSAFVDLNLYWRMDTDDGVYANPTRLLRTPSGSGERFVNVSLSAGVEWESGEHWFVSGLFTHAAPQDFIEATGSADDIQFVELTVRFRY